MALPKSIAAATFSGLDFGSSLSRAESAPHLTSKLEMPPLSATMRLSQRCGSQCGSRCSSGGVLLPGWRTLKASADFRGNVSASPFDLSYPGSRKLPTMFVNAPYKSEQFLTASQGEHSWSRRMDEALYKQKRPTPPVPAGVTEDSWGQGYRHVREWNGRKKGVLTQYQREVQSKLGSLLAVRS